MILHWLTTGWRSLVSNPLFSLITIISLSIGCCGALLVGANIKQHLSFDRWVPAADRTYILSRDLDEASFGPGVRFGGMPRWDSTVPAPVRDALEKQPDIEMMARSFRGQSLLPPDPSIPTTPPLPGEPPRTQPAGSIYVDPEFFDLFGFEFVEGSADGLKEPNQIVITEAAARRVFGDVSPVGQMTEGANKRPFRVVGVIKDLPDATHLRFEAISSVRTLEQITAANNAAQSSNMTPARSFNNWNNGLTATIYIRARADADPANFRGSLRQAAQTAADEGIKQAAPATGPGGMPMPMMNPRFDYKVVPLLDIHLGGPELTSIQSTGDIKLLATLGTAAFALLVVSAFNYVTLSLARSLRRRREVAVRKVLGADHGALVRHYLAESAIVTAISLIIGFLLAQLLHPWFARTIGQPETLFNLFDPLFLSISLIVFALLALAVGAYPAFYLANTRPRTALGEGGAASPGRMSQWVTGGLMGLQISAATGLLIVSLTMTAQASFIENRWLGFETKDRYQVMAPCPLGAQMPQEELVRMQTRCRTGVRTLLSRATDVSQPAFFQGLIIGGEQIPEAFGRSAQGEKLGEAVVTRVDLDFLQTMGARLIAGRMFDSASAYDKALSEYNTAMQARMRTSVQSDGQGRTMVFMTSDDSGAGPVRPARVPVVVTAAILPSLGVQTPDEAIGQQISMQPNSQYALEIIGVVEDWNSRPLKFAVSPIIFMPQGGNQAVIEIARDSLESVQTQLTQSWRDYLGNAPNASVILRPLAQTLEATYRSDFQLMRAVTTFALVAIAVAGLGVYGLSAFEMRRRVREIGIRKALGASPYAVGALVIGRALVFAAIAALIAWLPGFGVANAWLSDFVYRTNLNWVVLPIAMAIVVAFVALAVALSAVRAAAVRPGLALRV
jgi:putative ABC transport system permease protein